MSKHDLIQIDLEGIIRNKNPKLLKRIPSFILNWFKRFIHQDYINEILRKGHGNEGSEFIQIVFNELGVKTNSFGAENIPKTGGCIIAANHPLGGMDGMAMMLEVSKVRQDFLFLANDILLLVTPLKKHFLPVNRVGNSDRKSLSLIADAYNSGAAILIFPSGFVSRKIDGKVQDLPFQKSVIKKSLEHQLPIVPAFISGQNSKRFYRISQIRKIFKININFEMFTLPDEMFKQRGKTIDITFGKVLSSDSFKGHTHVSSAENLRKLIYQLAENPNATFNR
jgi:1-acyl-sn-glycerol-3-phosphate acyltransferase